MTKKYIKKPILPQNCLLVTSDHNLEKEYFTLENGKYLFFLANGEYHYTGRHFIII
jgi:hypothetical protein